MNDLKLEKLFENTFPFWEKMEKFDKETFLRSSHLLQFKKGTNIHDGNECTGVILVRSGCLRLYLLSDDGKEITLRRMFPGEICVLSASCVFDTIDFDIFVDSEENSECAVIGGCAYEDLARRMPDVKIFTLESALSTFSDIMWVMQQILFMSMDKRTEYGQERIGIQVKYGKLIVTGESLEICCLSKQQLVIMGKIDGVLVERGHS